MKLITMYGLQKNRTHASGTQYPHSI